MTPPSSSRSGLRALEVAVSAAKSSGETLRSHFHTEKRVELKTKMKKMDKKSKEYKRIDAEQYAIKLFLNASYGYMGYRGARWYSRRCAESATALARHYIKDIMKKAGDSGFEVWYGDTDSLMVGEKK